MTAPSALPVADPLTGTEAFPVDQDGETKQSTPSAVIAFAAGLFGITVQDEGVSLANKGTTVNFTGAGVSVTGTGAVKEVNITGGGGGGGGTAAATTATPGHGLAGNDVEEQLYELADGKLDFNDPLTLVSVTGAVTLTTGAFGKLHICSGTTYTVVLPTAVSNDGAVIALKVTASGLVTVDGNGSQTIDGALTLVLAAGEAAVLVAFGGNWVITNGRRLDEELPYALSDEGTTITTGTAKITVRIPFAFRLISIRTSLSTASSSGAPTVDMKEGGVSVLSTLVTIDPTEKTSVTANVPAVISDPLLADDAEVTFDVTVAGTGAKGLKILLIGKRVL